MDRFPQLMVIIQLAKVKFRRIARRTLYMLHLRVEHALLEHVYQFLGHVVVDVLKVWHPSANVVQPVVESTTRSAWCPRIHIPTFLLLIYPRILLVLMTSRQLIVYLCQHSAQRPKCIVHLLRLLLQTGVRRHEFHRHHLLGKVSKVNIHVHVQRSLLTHTQQHLLL